MQDVQEVTASIFGITHGRHAVELSHDPATKLQIARLFCERARTEGAHCATTPIRSFNGEAPIRLLFCLDASLPPCGMGSLTILPERTTGQRVAVFSYFFLSPNEGGKGYEKAFLQEVLGLVDGRGVDRIDWFMTPYALWWDPKKTYPTLALELGFQRMEAGYTPFCYPFYRRSLAETQLKYASLR
ncbi:MAG: hypothetical protein ABI747_04445 [Candidatus Moraniibacteriota bacterium]